MIDGSAFPRADDEYTPEQRRIIDARLDKAMDQVKTGRTYGPFKTHDEMLTFLHGEVKKAQPRTPGKSRIR